MSKKSTRKKASKPTAKRRRAKDKLVTVSAAYVDALIECSHRLEDVLEGPLTADLIEASYDALDSVTDLEDAEEDEEDDDDDDDEEEEDEDEDDDDGRRR